jgi:hypothetical protein
MKTKLEHELETKTTEENYKPLATDQGARNYWLISLQISVPFDNKVRVRISLFTQMWPFNSSRPVIPRRI